MLDWISENWVNIAAAYGCLVALCSIIVKFTPSTKDDEWLAKIVKVIDTFSTAFSKADKEKLSKAAENNKVEDKT